jgi:hypothetical protein
MPKLSCTGLIYAPIPQITGQIFKRFKDEIIASLQPHGFDVDLGTGCFGAIQSAPAGLDSA